MLPEKRPGVTPALLDWGGGGGLYRNKQHGVSIAHPQKNCQEGKFTRIRAEYRLGGGLRRACGLTAGGFAGLREVCA
jgi:hypothetical protein